VKRLKRTIVSLSASCRVPSGVTAATAENAMAAAGEQRQAGARGGFVFRLGQDASARAHHGIARQHQRAGRHAAAARAFSAARRTAWGGQFALARCFVDVGGQHPVGRHAQPCQQFEAARAGGGQDQGRQREGGVGTPAISRGRGRPGRA
jgi:hypothetical protein